MIKQFMTYLSLSIKTVDSIILRSIVVGLVLTGILFTARTAIYALDSSTGYHSKKNFNQDNSSWLEVQAEPSTLDISEKIQLKISHNLADNYATIPYRLFPNNLIGFDFNQQPRSNIFFNKNGELVKELIFELEPKDIGTFEVNLPPLKIVPYADIDQITHDNYQYIEILPEIFSLKVISVLKDDDRISEIFDVTYVKNDWKYLAQTVPFGILLAAIILFLTFPSIKGAETVALPFDRVIQELNELDKRYTAGSIDASILYLRLNSAFKLFLTDHMRLVQPGETLDEAIQRILELEDENKKYIIQEFVEISNIVKFAGYEPNPKLCKDALSSLKQLCLSCESYDDNA